MPTGIEHSRPARNVGRNPRCVGMGMLFVDLLAYNRKAGTHEFIMLPDNTIQRSLGVGGGRMSSQSKPNQE